MPYKDGYSVLPRLMKLEDDPLFQKDENYDHFLAEKKKAVKHQQCFLEHDITNEIYGRISSFIIEKADWVCPSTFDNLAMQLQEDIAIHRIKDGRDWLAACHICFPSGWRPEDKIGRPLDEIHIPIPGMNLNGGLKLAETMVNHGPFYRYVWSPVFDSFSKRRINYHPCQPTVEFDPRMPRLHLKVERQITYGFPDIGAALFVMRQDLLHPAKIDFPSLHHALSEMTDEEKAYKGVTDDLLLWMKKTWW